MKRAVRAVALGLLAASVALQGLTPATAQQPSLETITIAQTAQNLVFLPIYLAQNKGFFAKRGLKVEKLTAGNGTNAVAAVISGQAMFSTQDPMTAVLARLKGVKIVSVAALASRLPVWIAVKSDSPYRTINDLQGKLIATSMPPAATVYALQLLLAQRKITAQLQNQSNGTEIAPFLAGKTDAVNTNEPYLEQAISQGSRILYEFPPAFGEFAYTGVDVLEETIKKSPRTVQAFVDGLEEALRYMATDVAGTTDVALAEFPTLSPDVVRAAIKRMQRQRIWATHTTMSETSVNAAIAMQVNLGNIKPNAVTYADVFDPQFSGRAK